ncbi:MAG: phosphatase PAP2 family protein [Chloroflexi bacterium]|nr:phosphatase PAP2 family protein [Chloroflexota bacterium]
MVDRRRFFLQLGAVFIVLLGMAAVGEHPNTELIALVFAAVLVWTQAGRKFLREFAPALLLLLIYKRLRTPANELLGLDVNVQNLIDWEKWLGGGTLPNYAVQSHLWGQFYTPLLDRITNFFYQFHFLWPLILAALLWRYAYSSYRAYAVGLVVLSYAALIVYVVFPAAPPWWATYFGYLPDQPVSLDHYVTSAAHMARFSANPVAAMPSLHTAYPTFIMLVALRVWGRRALPIIALPLVVAFSTVYLGHHYVIDALAGAFFSAVTFATVYLPLEKRAARQVLEVSTAVS